MKTRGLSPAIVAAIGASSACWPSAGIFFFLIKPTLDATTVGGGRWTLTAGRAPDRSDSDGEQKQAEKLLDDEQDQGAADQTPVGAEGSRPDAALRRQPGPLQGAQRQLTYELDHYLGPDLEQQHEDHGRESTTKFTLPPPPVNPNDITNAPLVIPLGTVTVNGSFRHILTHFYDWQYFNRLVLVDGLSCTATAPT